MTTQAIPIERRQHPREGIMGQLENITYTILRKHGIGAEAPREAVSAGTSQARVQKRCRAIAARREREGRTGKRVSGHKPEVPHWEKAAEVRQHSAISPMGRVRSCRMGIARSDNGLILYPILFRFMSL